MVQIVINYFTKCTKWPSNLNRDSFVIVIVPALLISCTYKRLYFRGYYPCGHPRDTFCLHIVSVASATPRSASDVPHVLHVGTSSDGYKTLSYLGHHHFGRISVSVDLWPALFTVTQ